MGNRPNSFLGRLATKFRNQEVAKSNLAGGFMKSRLADGTAVKTDVTVAGMAVGDELIAVLALTTKASIATMTDRTSEYVIGNGKLVKAAGTDESDNQLIILYLDLT
jgi:hypothetical protein